MPWSSHRVRLFCLVLVALLVSGGTSPAGPDLFDEIFARGRPVQEKLQNVRARFTETTVSSLLAKPTVSKGTLLAAKPPRLVMRYTSPESKIIAMSGNRLVVIWPDRGESETLDVTETMKRVNQYFTNADPGDLRRLFAVRAFPDPEVANSYQLDMVPKRKQIRQGLERLQLWLHRETLLLVQMKMSFPGGDSDTIRLDEAEINVPLDPKAFDVEIPAGKKK